VVEGSGAVKMGYFDEGEETHDRLLTQHDIKAPAGEYVAEIGLARRDPADPTKVLGGLASIRIPVKVPAS